jgi:tripartite motif-containing protein 71
MLPLRRIVFMIFFIISAAWSIARPGNPAPSPADSSAGAGTGTISGRLIYIGWFGGKGSEPGRLNGPRAIRIDPAGRIYVADTGNQRIQKFDSLGNPLAAVGGFGWGSEQFNEPVSVWAGNGLDVFVADYDNGRIERYDRNLHAIATLRSSDEWAESLRFDFPLDVFFTPQSELFCLDGENRRVLKLDPRGEPQVSFGGLDSGEGRLTGPARLLVTAGNRVLVTDADEGRVVLFDSYGNFLDAFGEGVLDRPAGMAESPNGKLLFVCDAGNRRVHVFRGVAYDGSFGEESVPDGAFGTPVDAACWADRLYVLDRSGSEVLMFRWISAPGEAVP